jgi:alpha-galactosidase
MHGLPADADPALPGGVALSEKLILETADSLVSRGLRDSGYVYLNIDDRWQDPCQPRDESGRLRWDERRFPHGIPWVAEFVHERGLKFGLYTVANVYACGGEEGCGPCGAPATGSLGHERVDADSFAEWGVDFLKIDWCGVDEARNRGRAADVFACWNEAIASTGRDMIMSASTWGEEDEPAWAPRLTHMWRTTADLLPTWDSIVAVAQATADPRWSAVSGPKSGWNDPDFLQVGHPALTYAESKSHLVMWAMLSAPLLAGNDIRTASLDIVELLRNDTVLALDQDGSPSATLTTLDGEWDVWDRRLASGHVARAVINLADSPRRVCGSIDLPGDHDVFGTSVLEPLAPHDVVLFVT